LRTLKNMNATVKTLRAYQVFSSQKKKGHSRGGILYQDGSFEGKTNVGSAERKRVISQVSFLVVKEGQKVGKRKKRPS